MEPLRIVLVCSLHLALTTSLLAQTPVVFGEMETARYSYSICFDKNGTVYPEFHVSDKELLDKNGDLATLFQKDSILFEKVANFYHCNFSRWSEENFRKLQDSIILKKIKRFQQLSRDSSFTFLIHGFRKAFRDVNSDWTSTRDHAFARQTFGKQATRFIEVYWDAEYGCCFGTKAKRNRELFQLFEKAQKTSIPVGRSFSRFLDGFHDRSVNIIAHSLGAKVTTEACASSTSRNLTCILIAPAIDYNYLSEKIRAGNCKNQRWVIVYNKHDFVLKKKDPVFGIFGPGTKRYGVTNLGCNHRQAAIKLQKEIARNDTYTELLLENFSCIGKYHHLRTYLSSTGVERLKELLL